MAKKNSPGCNCCGGCSIAVCFNITDTCGGSTLDSATVVIKQAGVTLFTCTTPSGGSCCFTLTAAGSYTYTITKTGYTTIGPTTFTVVCGTPRNFNITMTGGTMICAFAIACNGGGVAGTFTFTRLGVVYSGLTDASGMFCSPTGITTGNWAVDFAPSDPCYSAPATHIVSASGCTIDSGSIPISTICCCFKCLPGPAFLVSASTLHFTSAVLGSLTLTQEAGLGCSYSGTINYAYPGAVGCPAATVPVTVELFLGGGTVGGSTYTVTYTYPIDASGCPTATAGTHAVLTLTARAGGTSSCSSSPFSLAADVTDGEAAGSHTILSPTGNDTIAVTL